MLPGGGSSNPLEQAGRGTRWLGSNSCAPSWRGRSSVCSAAALQGNASCCRVGRDWGLHCPCPAAIWAGAAGEAGVRMCQTPLPVPLGGCGWAALCS